MSEIPIYQIRGVAVALASDIATSSHGGTRYPPRAFTEHGVVMAATLRRSKKAVNADIDAKTIEADHRRLAFSAKQLRMAISIQSYLERGEKEDLLSVLKELGQ